MDFDDLVRKVNLPPTQIRKILNTIINQAVEELREKGSTDLPVLGKLTLDYINGEPIFYFSSASEEKIYFEPDEVLKKRLRKPPI